METLSLFLWKSIVVSGLLTAWYMLGLRGRRLHQYNRLFLLSILFASLTIPLLNFQLFTIPAEVTGNLAPVALFVQSAGEPVSSAVAMQPQQAQISWQAITGIAAASISLLLLVILSVRIFKVRSMCRQYPAAQLKGINLILTDSPKAPFTFLRYLFWNRATPLQSEMGQLIFKHELTHIEQGHTYDKLVCQIITCIFWFNPFYWLIQKELNIVHEFIADEEAVGSNDTETFAMMMLQSYNNGSYLVPEHHFFSSTVKRRLTMLQNATQPSYSLLRRFMAVPLVACAILLFSIGCRNGMTSEIAPAKKKIVVLLDAGHGGQETGGKANGFTEKDICLQYARRVKELSPAYNIEVQLTRDNDRDLSLANRTAISSQRHPDVFISLHVGEEAGKEKSKGDFDIYVAGGNAYSRQSSNYSTAIFQAMEQNAIIPGMEKTCNHDPSQPCSNCSGAAVRTPGQKDGIYVLKHAEAPGLVMVLGNINNKEGMQQLTSNNQMDVLCNAILKGIVDGANTKESVGKNGPACQPACGTIQPAAQNSYTDFASTLPNR